MLCPKPVVTIGIQELPSGKQIPVCLGELGFLVNPIPLAGDRRELLNDYVLGALVIEKNPEAALRQLLSVLIQA
ncbi:hypothetical protein [Cohaesibacter celericrescens]|uniref:hypothetical protein n=1 Tax=Cohaesibacter celericrescens TaxID=2067669 RepID=UPI0035674909